MSIARKHTNVRMRQIVIHGGTVYLAGQVAVDAAGELAGAQMRNVLDRIDGLLGEAGSVVDTAACAAALRSGMAERNADAPEARGRDPLQARRRAEPPIGLVLPTPAPASRGA